MMPWFRLYPEILKDPKIRRFTTVQKWLWITAMCEAAQATERGKLFIAEGVEYTDEDLAQAAGLRASEFDQAIGFIDMCVTLKMMERHADGGVTLLNFNSRQYEKPSDTPDKTRERKRKQRAKEAENKKQPASKNVDVTEFPEHIPGSRANVMPMSRQVTPGHAIDTDTDSDTETDSYTETEEKEPLPPLPSTNKKQEPVVVVVGGKDLHVYKSVIDQYKHYFVYEPNHIIMNLLHSYLEDGVQMDMLAWAMREAAEKGKPWGYAKGTIEKLFSCGIRTAEQADLADQVYKQKREQRPAGKVVQLVDKLPESVQWQMQQEKDGAIQPSKGRLLQDDPELMSRLERMRKSRTASR
ncbi:phage replisome organizer N-terminal domain-containing protein [Brevibacillus sp. HD1.4A]|uniref:phage replisome organizer N-terminal domain-containing protein n=1 Tax=Brevibacillus sp. HD1.4A TaxID=2738978 RepID=UPI00156BAC1C|nr:phage replisome organizer N-terminal domain-containing protein [Brevibacillus sp. HD1.4A]NRQ51956.1 phage replisome organizer N-terminal domain-containing protein [Brevibacillus sp. HD1.4A]